MEDKLFGIDVSLYQGDFDFVRAAREGVKFVIVKGSESNFVDPKFTTNYTNAKSAGLWVGVYHYLKAANPAEAVAQAKFMIDNCLKGRVFEYPVFVDVEDPSMQSLSKEALTECVRSFCDTLENAGYWAGFYTNLDWYLNRLDGAPLAERYSYWLAYWGTNPPPTGCQMWQFGGEYNPIRANTVAGVVCDQDYSYMNYPSKIAAKGLNGMKKTSAEKTDVKDNNGIFKVGDRVKLAEGAPVYGSDEKFYPWVYNAVLYVREISGNRIVISTLKSGAVTGAVDRRYLTKV